MSEVLPLSDHCIVEDRPDGLVITIPAGRRRTIAIATAALVIWLAAEILGLDYMIRLYPIQARDPAADVFPPHGLMVLWTILGIFLLCALLWQLLGETVVRIEPERIHIQHRALGLGLGPARTYLRQGIMDLRVEHEVGYQTYMADRRRNSTGPVQLPTCHVAFDYGRKVARFGSRMDHEEAARLVAAIVARFPQYGGQTCSSP